MTISAPPTVNFANLRVCCARHAAISVSVHGWPGVPIGYTGYALAADMSMTNYGLSGS